MLSCIRISTLARAVFSTVLCVLLAVQVAAAFLPISPGTVGSGTAISAVICSADGMRTVTLPEAASEPPEQTALHGHCPLCIMAATLPGPANLGAAVGQIETRLHARFVAASQTRIQFGGRPDAIRAPPQPV